MTRTKRTLQEYLTNCAAKGIIDFAFRATAREDGTFYITVHPDGKNGDTVDFVVNGGTLFTIVDTGWRKG